MAKTMELKWHSRNIWPIVQVQSFADALVIFC